MWRVNWTRLRLGLRIVNCACPARARLRTSGRRSGGSLRRWNTWTDDPVPGASLAGEGWVLPGLVDAHTHPGAGSPGEPFTESLLRKDLRKHVAAGVMIAQVFETYSAFSLRLEKSLRALSQITGR